MKPWPKNLVVTLPCSCDPKTSPKNRCNTKMIRCNERLKYVQDWRSGSSSFEGSVKSFLVQIVNQLADQSDRLGHIEGHLFKDKRT